MQKNKLFIIISCLILIVLIGTAALCNTCGLNAISENASRDSEESKKDQSILKATETEEVTKETSSIDTAKEDTTDTTKSSTADSINNPPKIDNISLISTGEIVTNTMYDVTTNASDPLDLYSYFLGVFEMLFLTIVIPVAFR